MHAPTQPLGMRNHVQGARSQPSRFDAGVGPQAHMIEDSPERGAGEQPGGRAGDGAADARLASPAVRPGD